MLDLINNTVQDKDPDLILLSETWLTPYSPTFKIPGYDFHHLDRQNRKGGGVGILSSINLRCNLRKDLSSILDESECVTIDITMAVFQRDAEFNEPFIKPIHGLYEDQAITVTEFKERNAGILTNRWVDTSHGTKGDKIYGMFDPSTDPEIVKENLQEWLCNRRMEVTECISIALRNHERTFSEWFRYVDSCSSPDKLALYCPSRKHGIHTSVLNKSYIWTTLSNHLAQSHDEIIELCGVNLVFLGPARYGILRKIHQPLLQSSSNNTTSVSTSSITPTVRSQKTTCREGGATGCKKRECLLVQGHGKHRTVPTSTSRK